MDSALAHLQLDPRGNRRRNRQADFRRTENNRIISILNLKLWYLHKLRSRQPSDEDGGEVGSEEEIGEFPHVIRRWLVLGVGAEASSQLIHVRLHCCDQHLLHSMDLWLLFTHLFIFKWLY